MRKPIIAGNWKMNNTISEGIDLINGIKEAGPSEDVESLVCVPYTVLADAKKALKGSTIKLGAQNMHYEESGAFTGEISVLMLKEIGVDYVLVGHSERRQYFNETDETVNKKMHKALEYGIRPILCVGESLDERESGEEKEIVKSQVEKAFKGIDKAEIKNTVIAYEPIWAIGTGKTASADDANEMLGYIREIMEELYDREVKKSIRLQYGGSVNPSTIEELMDKANVDGALVGGASLKAKDFIRLINY